MKKILYIIAFLLVTTSVRTKAVDIVELKLSASNKIVFKFMFTNGSITDPAGKEGLTMLTTDLIGDGGTTQFTSTQLKDFLYPMAARVDYSVDKEVTIFTFEVHVDHLSKFYPMMMDLVTNPRFDESDFRRIKSNLENYVEQVIRTSSDEEYSKKALEDLLFRGTNYQHMTYGTVSGIKNITLADCKSHFNSFFRQDNLTVGIAGNYDANLLAKIKADVKKLPAGPPDLPKPGLANKPDGVQVEIIAKKNALGSAIFTGVPLSITRSSDDFAALMVANSWLGEHRKSYSRLYQKIREERSMNYGDYSYIEWYQNGGGNMLPPPGVPRTSNYFSIWIRPVQIAKGLKQQYPELADITIGHAHFALRMAFKELNEMISHGMSWQDFELTRTFLRSYIKLYTQTPERQLGFLMDSKFYGRMNYINEMDTLLAKLTPADVNKAIKKYWSADNMYVTIVTDVSEAEPLAKSLEQNLPSPMSYSRSLKEALPANILKEDDEVANFKLNVKSVKIVDSNNTFQ
ncbi:MAG TPA: pitrilysin family protein [Cyclobacteriaceae bacterium]|nr:pitrilysin family protein [Cyclobacteriaceae bacterium]